MATALHRVPPESPQPQEPCHAPQVFKLLGIPPKKLHWDNIEKYWENIRKIGKNLLVDSSSHFLGMENAGEKT